MSNSSALAAQPQSGAALLFKPHSFTYFSAFSSKFSCLFMSFSWLRKLRDVQCMQSQFDEKGRAPSRHTAQITRSTYALRLPPPGKSTTTHTATDRARCAARHVNDFACKVRFFSLERGKQIFFLTFFPYCALTLLAASVAQLMSCQSAHAINSID